jgi:hypothetical protein
MWSSHNVSGCGSPTLWRGMYLSCFKLFPFSWFWYLFSEPTYDDSNWQVNFGRASYSYVCQDALSVPKPAQWSVGNEYVLFFVIIIAYGIFSCSYLWPSLDFRETVCVRRLSSPGRRAVNEQRTTVYLDYLRRTNRPFYLYRGCYLTWALLFDNRVGEAGASCRRYSNC